MDQYGAVAVGAQVGMMWPYVVKLIKSLGPQEALRAVAPAALGGTRREGQTSGAPRYAAWGLLTLVAAAAIAALNTVPLVAGDQTDALEKLGGWQYFFLGSEGFGLAAFLNEGLCPK